MIDVWEYIKVEYGMSYAIVLLVLALAVWFIVRLILNKNASPQPPASPPTPPAGPQIHVGKSSGIQTIITGNNSPVTISASSAAPAPTPLQKLLTELEENGLDAFHVLSVLLAVHAGDKPKIDEAEYVCYPPGYFIKPYHKEGYHPDRRCYVSYYILHKLSDKGKYALKLLSQISKA